MTSEHNPDHAKEVESGERFEFGKNWTSFLKLLDEDRISSAVEDLQHHLSIESLEGRTFIDIGSGSGLSSLAARKLGAEVLSFDFDPSSVWCTNALKNKYFPGDDLWKVHSGSILDNDYLSSLPKFDVVYSWGVLHHTGEMWAALNSAISLVKDSGYFYIAIYNDQGGQTKRWTAIKKIYNLLPTPLDKFFAVLVSAPLEIREILVSCVKLDPMRHFRHIADYKSQRGMSYWHDIIDWMGGYPFEVATPEEIFEFCRLKGFQLHKLKTVGGGLGCNVFVFKR